MSVSSVSSTQQIYQPYRPPPSTGFNDTGAPSASGSGASQGSRGISPFQKLASDLQSALVSLQSQTQSATGTTGVASAASGASAATSNPTDALSKLSADLQSILGGSQSSGPAGAGATQATTGAHHGHHHHHAGSDVAFTAEQPGTASTATATSDASGAPKSFMGDIMNALQAYTSGNKASTSLTSAGSTASLMA